MADEPVTKESLMKKYGLPSGPTKKKKKVVKKKVPPKARPKLGDAMTNRQKRIDEAGGF